ncbi:MAG: hypothetical protein KGL39_48445 [Patescibacteria group bacterium]|nr:hypothetical protein [Patescibacteria group bacterium]
MEMVVLPAAMELASVWSFSFSGNIRAAATTVFVSACKSGNGGPTNKARTVGLFQKLMLNPIFLTTGSRAITLPSFPWPKNNPATVTIFRR